MLVELRADGRAQGLKEPGEILAMKWLAALTGRAGLLEAFQRFAGVVSRVLFKDGKVGWLPPPRLSGWTERRDFPAPAPQPFRTLWKKRKGIRPWNR